MKKLLTSVLLIITTFCYAQLPRRVYLGIRMENLTADSKRIMGLESIKGVLISEVMAGSTAAAAGLKRGDILTEVNRVRVGSTEEVFEALAGKQGGSAFYYTVLRDKNAISGASTFRSFPEEKYNGLDVIYTDASSSVGQLRIIINRPKKAGRLPLVAFIGGIGCYSLDFATDSTRGEVQLLNALSRAGYMCARLEKPGQGDNAKHSKPCQEVSFTEEAEGYIASINALKKRADVDSNAVYIIGHSMGGVFAPLIAGQTKVNGIIAYGTIGSNFQEHLSKTRRTIAAASEMSPEETDAFIKDYCACSGYYFVDKLTTEEAAKKNRDCKDYLSVFDLRARAYNDELYGFNIPALWKSFSGRALLLWGESDFVSSKEDHQIVANSVNYYHPGQGTFATIKRADHGMNSAASFVEARNRPGSYNPEVGRAIINWLKNQS